MQDYQCSVGCGMGISGLVCTKCSTDLIHSTISKDDGTEVHVSKCPECEGKIKSPTCCGADMAPVG